MAIQLDGTTGISTSGNITAAGTLTVGLFNPGNISASGNVVGANLITAGELSVGGNSVITGDLTVVGNASLSGNIIGDKITNGSTSVEIPVANGNVSFTIGGSTNVVVVTTTGGFVTGVVSATGNITGSNLNASGLSLASNVLSAINSTSAITTSANVSANNVVVTNHVNASGNISGDNVLSAGQVSAIGNVTGSNLLTAGVVSSAGNITGGNIATIGLISSAGNITGDNILTGGLISAAGNITGGNILGGANVNATTHTGTTVSVTGNITSGNLQTSGTLSTAANIIIPGALNASGNGKIFFNNNGTLSANIILYQEGANGNVTVRIGESATEGFGLYSTGTIGAIGNLTSLSNIIGNNISSANIISATGNITGNYILGNGSQLTGIDATSIQNGTSNVRVVSSGGNVAIGVGGTSNVAVYATTGEYVTGLISATGNITGGNILTGGLISATGTITSADTITGGNLATGGTASATGNVTGGNVLTGGLISATGNITGGNILGGANVNATTHTGTTVSVTGNITGGNANIGGSLNVTSLLTVDGGTYGNVVTTPFASIYATGIGPNPYSIMQVRSNDGISGMGMQGYANINGLLYSNTGITIQTGATLRDKDYPTGGTTRVTIDSTGLTVTGIGNISGNVTGGNVLTGGLISATGNVTGGNVISNTVVGTGLTLISTGDLTLSTTGNINANNEYINNIPQPQQNADAANKQYVDNLVSTAISYHSPVIAATISNLDTATGGTITYAQPNGVANGVGATLTTTGSFNLIDTANIQTIGTRVLVKDEGNAVFNGVYTWANATVIVRATDADTYGAGSATQLGINDYFFVQSGNVNAGAAYIVNAPSGTITFGTSNITFAEFSKAQIYSANTSAGISLAGTVINALVDNVTTAFSTGNIVVKASAQLTTPNIGDATGTSLSTTGNITGGNLSGTSIVGTLTTAAQTNITSVGTLGSLTVTGNATGGNLLTGGLISATGNISGGNLSGTSIVGTLTTAAQTNITSVGTLGSLAVTGNTTSGNFVGTLNGSGANVTSISADNISSGTLAQARLANASLTVNGTLIALGGSGTVTATATGTLTIGTGLGGTSYNGSTGVTITNTGVTSIVAGTNISVSGGTGAVTVNVSGTVASATQATAATDVNGTNASLGYSTSAVTVGSGGQAGPQVLGQGGGAAVMSFHRPGAYAINMGLDTDNVFKIGGWSDGASTYRFQVASGGAITAATFSGISTTAKYADLSENYAADAYYEPATVLDFGGNEEVTLNTKNSSVRVAGVVSTNPAHLMNSHLEATHVVALALSGRVPAKVTGTIRKGDMMVSDGQGRACACATPAMGTVIGKALENFDGESGVIEIVVGRL
jgi:hypothetical protein